MSKLKQVTRQEFKKFLANYDGKINPHCWNETTLYCDFDRPSQHPIGSAEKIDDSLIAKSYEPWFDLPAEYYILDEEKK